MQSKLNIRNTILCALFIALTVVGAYIKIPLPFVPFSLQTLFVILAGMVLGAKYGALSMGIYMLLGLLGLPVFTGGGGFAYVLKPTFGYIIGFVVSAFATGVIINKFENPKFNNYVTAGVFGMAMIYIFGMGYYYILTNFMLGTPIDTSVFFVYFFLLTLPGDIVKCLAAASVAVTLKRVLPKMQTSN